MNSVGVNPFVRRQTADSRFSHFGGSFEDVAALAAATLAADEVGSVSDGYRDGVLLVSVSVAGFFSGVVAITPETVLRTTFESRAKGERPVKVTVAVGAEKMAARHVELVLYRRDVLLEEGPDAAPTGCIWELVSINARPTLGPEPMTPSAMARNFLALPGGTKAEYTAEQFAAAILYWEEHAMAGGE